MNNLPLLSLLIFSPLFGILPLLCCMKDAQASSARFIALTTSLVTFIISIIILLWFKPQAGFQFEEQLLWIADLKISYHVALDGVSILFIILTTLLTPICILASKDAVKNNIAGYMIAFLLLETTLLLSFSALDLLLFYLSFEAMLIPMFFVIGVWGGTNRIYASFKFFLYTFAGSLFLLLAIIYIYVQAGTTDFIALLQLVPNFAPKVQNCLWLCFFASFAVKVPMWPFHTWLPDAHVQAPTSGSVMLAGVLLKIGGYGFLRFSLQLLPDASFTFMPLMIILSVVAIIYASFVALAQTDMKKLIAYSSVAHMGFVTMGIFTGNNFGIQGAVVQMISHGLISAALFLGVGVLYDRVHSREISDFGGVAARMPLFAALFLFFTLASIGLPGLSGFVGEFLALLGIYALNKTLALLAATSIVLGAAYMLWLYKRVMLGAITSQVIAQLSDLKYYEAIPLMILAILVLVLGIYPVLVLDLINPTLDCLTYDRI
jgi:NADH-quinone oxidoreductase subunit M